MRPFVEDPERTVAVGGTIRIANGCKIAHGRVVEVGAPRNILALLQTVEYLRAFLMARIAWSRIDALTIISGAFRLFRRQAVLDVGGYSHGTVGDGHGAGRQAAQAFPAAWQTLSDRLHARTRLLDRGAGELVGAGVAGRWKPSFAAAT